MVNESTVINSYIENYNDKLNQLQTNHRVFSAMVDELIDAKIPDRQVRIKAIDELIEDYFKVLGRMPEGAVLNRLTNEILREELTDTRKNKVQTEEYPFLSETQVRRRTEGVHQRIVEGKPPTGEIRNLSRIQNIGTDGKDYRKPTRKKLSIEDMLYIDQKNH